MNGRRSKLARKAARVVKTESYRQFDAELAVARQALQEEKQAATTIYTDGIDKLAVERLKAFRKATERFEARRAELLKKFSAMEAEELAAA